MICELDLSLTSARWVNAICTAVFAALLLGDRVGRKTVFEVKGSVMVMRQFTQQQA